jgi:hypothetical protein
MENGSHELGHVGSSFFTDQELARRKASVPQESSAIARRAAPFAIAVHLPLAVAIVSTIALAIVLTVAI